MDQEMLAIGVTTQLLGCLSAACAALCIGAETSVFALELRHGTYFGRRISALLFIIFINHLGMPLLAFGLAVASRNTPYPASLLFAMIAAACALVSLGIVFGRSRGLVKKYKEDESEVDFP